MRTDIITLLLVFAFGAIIGIGIGAEIKQALNKRKQRR